MATIFVGKSRAPVLIDREDAVMLAEFSWRLKRPASKWPHHASYARAGSRGILMHRVILGCPATLEVDHVNGDGLDNRKSNLRFCTRDENRRNSRKCRYRTNPQAPPTSRFKGVHFDSGPRLSSGQLHHHKKPWRAKIMCNGAQKTLGRFSDEIAAAVAYDTAARVHFGFFAKLNFPEDSDRRATAMTGPSRPNPSPPPPPAPRPTPTPTQPAPSRPPRPA